MNEVDILEKKAVNAALTFRWKEAVEINKKIIKLDKNNLSAHLRLGFIYLQTNELKEAKKHYKATLRIQPGHLLATENLEKIQILQDSHTKKRLNKDLNFNPNLFLEVPGKTKVVVLVNLGQKNILAQLTIGEEVYLKEKTRKIEIRTKNDEYLGSLPDDLSKRLLLFIKAGSEYQTFIKDVSLSRAVIFIREENKGKKVAKYSSFPKNTQANISRLSGSEEDHAETDEEEIIDSDLEKLADILTHEEKEFLPYQAQESQEDEENIEE